MKKRKSLQRRKEIKFGDKVLVSILSSLVNLSPTNLRSGLSQFSGFLHSVFVTLKGIEQGHFSRPLPCLPRGMRAKCQDMQMRLWGSNRQEGLMAALPPILMSTIKYSNGILLEGRGMRGFPEDAGHN